MCFEKTKSNTMTAQELFNEVREFCELNADSALVEKYSRYFKEGVYDGWGVGLPILCYNL